MRACTEHAKQQTITCQETWPSNKQTRPRALLEYEIPPILGGIPALKLLPRGPCPSPDLRLHHAPPAPSRALLESPKEGGVALAVRARGGAYEHSAPSDDGDECVVLAGRGGGTPLLRPWCMLWRVCATTVMWAGGAGRRRTFYWIAFFLSIAEHAPFAPC